MIDQYDFLLDSSDKIKHYNFCDEQDPVGHHLDMARSTDIYGHIFSTPDQSDIVYQRYGVPGLAHNMYWDDDDLFKGILEQIIDNSQSSIDLTSQKFRMKNNAKKQGCLWAYFRIPLILSLITSLLITYSMNNIFNKHEFSGVLWLLITLYLWVTPAFSTFFKKRGDVRNVDQSTSGIILESPFSKGLFSLLISTAIKWRRLLVIQAEGCKQPCEADRIYLALQNRGVQSIWKQFFWRWLWRVVTAIAIFCSLLWLFLTSFSQTTLQAGVKGMLSAAGSIFRAEHLFSFIPFGDLITNVVLFTALTSVVIYLIVSIWVFIYFFWVRKKLGT